MERSTSDEIANVAMGRPHVVLLGAGASRAAFPRGERAGRRLPLMADFHDIVPVGDILSTASITTKGENFEDIYSNLASNPATNSVRVALETAVLNYFTWFALPEKPTLYDHLVLSLRSKDVIATFNWDPFLIQAVRRNGHLATCPLILFLHGNVLDAYCERDRVHGVKGARCSRCGRPFKPVGLLYPIREKNYESHPAIHAAWQKVRWAFENAFMVTIFGYSAPQSDRAAVDLLLESWGGSQKRHLEQFEIIDIRDEKALVDSWQPFIHSHHYEVHANFYESWIANHPRRTGEAYWSQYMEVAYIQNNSIPRTESLEELWSWYKPLIDAEHYGRDRRRTDISKRHI